MRTPFPLLLCCALLASTCGNNPEMGGRVLPGERADGVRQVPLRPGVPASDPQPVANPYAADERALADGERLYNWMNCSGCHFAGGGGIGPPLMDDDWIYGGRPEQIFDSIVNGRANGMPAYGDKLSADQVWHIVAHVQRLHQPENGDGR